MGSAAKAEEVVPEIVTPAEEPTPAEQPTEEVTTNPTPDAIVEPTPEPEVEPAKAEEPDLCASCTAMPGLKDAATICPVCKGTPSATERKRLAALEA